jgi:hypothetical protein
MPGSREYGDEPSGSGASELVQTGLGVHPVCCPVDTWG